MTIFADASALVSIIAGEPDARELAACLQDDRTRICSSLSAWETVAGLCHSYLFSVQSAQQRVRLFLDELSFGFVVIGEQEFTLAIEAYAQFGKGRHPARLNMGDCYAYACAKAHGAKLLFKGDDFPKTDIAPALVGRPER